MLDPRRRLCLPHRQRLGPLQPLLRSPALLGAASSAQKAEKAPGEVAAETLERPPQQNSVPVPAGRMRRRGQERLERKRLSSDPSLGESTCEPTQKNSQKRVTYLLEVEEGWRTGERVRKHA